MKQRTNLTLTRTLAILLLAQPLVTTGVGAVPYSDPDFVLAAFVSGAADAAGAGGDAYREGQRALDDSRWDVAAESFARVAAAGGGQVDAALYWQAYAEHRMGRDREAQATLDRLAANHGQSAWLDDAEALSIEINGGRGSQGDRDRDRDRDRGTEEDELKLYALNALMNVEPERALPLLQKVLQGNSSMKVREQALFVLSQHESPRASALLAEVARGSSQPELQEKALEYLGMMETPESLRLLEEVYRTSTSRAVKEQVLESFMIADAKDRVLAVAKTEKDAALRRKAVEMLGVMEGTGMLHELFKSEPDVTVRRQIVEALAIAEDVTFLAEAARDADAGIRRQAIEGLGMNDTRESRDALQKLYRTADRESKKGILDAFMMHDDAAGLIAVAKTETDRDLRRQALERLSSMDSEEAQAFLLEALE